MRIIDSIVNNSGNIISFNDFAREYYDFRVPRSKVNYFSKAKATLDSIKVILDASPDPSDAIKAELVGLLSDDIRDIIQAVPSEIPNLITKYTTGRFADLLYDASGQTNLGKEIENAFDYSAFRSSSKASWFCEMLRIKSCLYCNAQFALVVGKEGAKKKLLFQLDHFYNKNRYPFLSLTIGNLVPSCSTCNISKSKKEFSINSHIHPYHEDANLAFEFDIDSNNVLEYLLNSKDVKLLIPKIKLAVPGSRFQSHLDTFVLENIYYKHTDIIEEMFLKSIYYTQSKRKEIEKDFKSQLCLDISTINRFILGNYSLDSEINNRPLAKMMKDIGKLLGII